jgi:hypothetical protein
MLIRSIMKILSKIDEAHYLCIVALLKKSRR